MKTYDDQPSSMLRLRTFLERPRPPRRGKWTAVSLFSGAGISDMGYRLAGFRFLVQAELNEGRARLGQGNFPESTWIVGDVRQTAAEIIATYRSNAAGGELDLLTATPPCQGMSSSNPSRGKRHSEQARRQEDKNRLLLAAVPVVRALKPRVVVAENVRQILTLRIEHDGATRSIIDAFQAELPEYDVFQGVIQAADHGIPQGRRRGLVVAVRKDQPWLDKLKGRSCLPWPRPTYAERPDDGQHPWVTVSEWFKAMEYEPLDARSPETSRGADLLHYVPHYPDDRYLWVEHIPPLSGRNAYQNDTCLECGFKPVPEGLAHCSACGALMRNRPYVVKDGVARLVKGFKSSYRRMSPDRPAPTVTTNSSSIGSDFKLHPWENRVLSVRECADLQTVPRFYDWSWATTTGHPYAIRQAVGEALPTYFAYLHGKVLGNLLAGRDPARLGLAHADKRKGNRRGTPSSVDDSVPVVFEGVL